MLWESAESSACSGSAEWSSPGSCVLQKTAAVSLRASLIVIVIAVAASGCSRSSHGAPEKDAGFGVDVTIGERLDAPPVRFRADVVPILEARCAFASCHGDRTAAHGVFLGRGAPHDAHDGLVGVVSARYRGQVLVKPFDSGGSFVMRKIDGTLAGLSCGDACGAPMPKKNPPLAARERIVVARWIAQGAKDD